MARANTEVRMKELLGWGCTKRERKWPILGRDAAYSLPTPVSASLNCTCTSSATMEVSPHSPSPILNCRRLSGSVPVAVVVVPDWASCTGMLTFWTWPLMLSLPSTWYLPPPSALTAVESNTACGNLATLNQSALGSSASVSLAPMVALPVSTVKRILLVSGLAVSNWTWASNFLVALQGHAHLLGREVHGALGGHELLLGQCRLGSQGRSEERRVGKECRS